MEADEYIRIAATQRSHWWYQSTRALLEELIPATGTGDLDRVILDLGCGPGTNLSILTGHGSVTGVDPVEEALEACRSLGTGARLVTAIGEDLPFASAAVDLVVCATVLYTIASPERAMAEIRRVLAPGAALVVIEPAFPALRRRHDRQVHGRRRFRRRGLEQLATAAGLQVIRSTYAYSFLAPAAAVLAAADRRPRRAAAVPTSDLERNQLGGLLGTLAGVERRIIARHPVPFGTSVAMVAVRP